MSKTSISTLMVIGSFLLLIGQVAGQISGNSPYSRFGLGDLTSGNFVHLQSLGGISAAYGDAYQTNLANPASLARLQATAFESGFDVSRAFLKSSDQNANFWGGGMNYLALSFPVLNPLNRTLDRKTLDFSWGMSMSLSPYSKVNATSSLTEEIENIGSITREFEGTGGLNQVTFANGFKHKNLYAGLRLSYVFGQILQERSILYNSIPLPYHIYSRDNFSFRGFIWNLGLQYDLDLGKDGARDREGNFLNGLTFGLSFGTSAPLTTTSDQYRATRGATWTGLSDDVIDSNQEQADTILLTEAQKENGNLPSNLNLGVVWRKGEKWLVGVNYIRAGWSNFSSSVLSGSVANVSRFGIGAEFRPDANSYRFYHHKIKYRAGLTFGSDPRLIDGNQLKEVTVDLGVGLPIFLSRQISFINLGIEYASRGGDVPITENTLRFKMGVTLNNNLWFYKRKYN